MCGANYGPTHDKKEMVKIITISEILSKMLEGVMFHGEQTDVFEFLNYKGFSQIHRKQSLEEYESFRKFRDCMISITDKIEKISGAGYDRKNSIPEIFYSADKFKVTPQERKKYTKESFDKYLAWEKSVVEFYSKAYKEFMGSGNVCIAEKIMCVLKDTEKELNELKVLYIELENTEYGAHHLERIQPELANKYKL